MLSYSTILTLTQVTTTCILVSTHISLSLNLQSV